MKRKYRQLTMERRSTRRYSVKEGVYVAFSSGRLLVGTIENFCKDGLCFKYLDEVEGARPEHNGEITIFSYNHGFFLDKIKCSVVRNQASVSEPSFIEISMKSMAVKFNDLDQVKKEGITSFINHFCVKEDIPGFLTEKQHHDDNQEYGQYMKFLKVVNI